MAASRLRPSRGLVARSLILLMPLLASVKDNSLLMTYWTIWLANLKQCSLAPTLIYYNSSRLSSSVVFDIISFDIMSIPPAGLPPKLNDAESFAWDDLSKILLTRLCNSLKQFVRIASSAVPSATLSMISFWIHTKLDSWTSTETI